MSSLLTKKQDTKMMQNIDNKQDTSKHLLDKLSVGAVMRSRFNKGDIVICWLKGGSYGDKFTVLEDTGGLTLLCHKTGGLCIVNNREDYDFA